MADFVLRRAGDALVALSLDDARLNELSYERMLEELPEASTTCPRCGVPEGSICPQPDHRCPYGCLPG